MTPEQWERLKDLLMQLLALDTASQRVLLDQELGNDSALRAEIEDLLRSMELTSVHMTWLTPPTMPASEAAPPVRVSPVPHRLEPGDMCGRYQVDRLLGSGGMGRVYLATDTELSTQVALKVPSEHLLESSEARIRLRGEARNAARLRGHPHIATFLELIHVDVKGRQFPVMVMEHVDGRSCAQHLAEHAVSLPRVLRWASQIAEAVEYAHDHGVLHCDLKPQNVQVTADDTVKVLDFGVARALYGPSEAETASGTIPYMAPEQLSERRFTETGDIYSLGVTIFELVTRQRPFIASNQLDLVLEIIGSPAPRLSSHVPDVPVALDVLIARTLAKRPQERPQSMSELRREIDALLLALDPQPPGAWERWAPWLRAIGTLLALLTFVGFVTSFTFDQALGRAGRFDDEWSLWWPVWGVRMLVAPVVVCAFFSLPVILATVFIRSLGRRLGPPAWLRRPFDLLASASANQLAILVLAASILGVNLFVWGFEPAIGAIVSVGSNEPMSSMAWLREENNNSHNLYRYLSFFLWTLSAWGWVVVARRRKRRLEATGIAFSVLGALVLCVALGLWALPYRLLFQAKLEKFHLGSEACYVAGRESSDLLLFCPRATPPRTRVVKADDPLLKSDSKIEKIFMELNTGTNQ